MGTLEDMLAEEGRLIKAEEAAAAAKSAEKSERRDAVLVAVRKLIAEHGFTAEELFPAQPAAPGDAPPAPADVGEWDEPKLTAEAENLYRAGKSDTEVASALKLHQPDAMLRAKAQQAGKTAAESGS